MCIFCWQGIASWWMLVAQMERFYQNFIQFVFLAKLLGSFQKKSGMKTDFPFVCTSICIQMLQKCLLKFSDV